MSILSRRSFYSQSAVSLFFQFSKAMQRSYVHALFKTALFWKLQILLQRTAKKVLWNCPNMHITCKCFLSYKCAFLCFYTNLAQILGIVADILRRFLKTHLPNEFEMKTDFLRPYFWSHSPIRQLLIYRRLYMVWICPDSLKEIVY